MTEVEAWRFIAQRCDTTRGICCDLERLRMRGRISEDQENRMVGILRLLFKPDPSAGGWWWPHESSAFCGEMGRSDFKFANECRAIACGLLAAMAEEDE